LEFYVTVGKIEQHYFKQMLFAGDFLLGKKSSVKLTVGGPALKESPNCCQVVWWLFNNLL